MPRAVVSGTCSFADRNPAVVGVAERVSVHELPGATAVLEQVSSLMAKSPGLAPDMVAAPRFRGAVPVETIVTVLPALVCPSGRTPNCAKPPSMLIVADA